MSITITNKTFLVVLVSYSALMLLAGFYYLIIRSEMVFFILSIPYFFILLFVTTENKYLKVAAQIGAALILLIGLIITLLYLASNFFWKDPGSEIMLSGIFLIISGLYLLAGCHKYILSK